MKTPVFNKVPILMSLELKLDPFNEYYLCATYRIESEHKSEKVVIPHICIPFAKDTSSAFSIDDARPGSFPVFNIHGLNFRLHEGDVDFSPEPCFYAKKTICEKSVEMTMDELEKKLGYKVKIIND